jgi:2-haloacid dehalogenase
MAQLHIHNVHSTINNVRLPVDANTDANTDASTEHRARVAAVVFDLGGVLLDWNPRHLYRTLFADEAEMESFLAQICTPEWHDPHDRGVSTAESCAVLAAKHPHFSEEIWAWSKRSEEMIGGVDEGSVDVLRAVRETGLPCYALTNMEAETYPLRLERFAFLGWFDGTVVSAREGMAKPDGAIFELLLDRFGLAPGTTLMIDDSKANLDAASRVGIQTILFRSSDQLGVELEEAGVLFGVRLQSPLPS